MTASVTGLSELKAFLDQLPAKMEKNIMRAALRSGAKVVLEEAKAKVPEHTGLLKQGLKISTKSKAGTVVATVKATGKHAYVARWVEYGTAAHRIMPKKAKTMLFAGMFVTGVDHPGAKAKPFLRPALDTQSQAALLAVGETIKARLTKQGLDASGVDLEAA